MPLVISLATGQLTLATMPGSGGALTAQVPPGRYEFVTEVETAASSTSQPSTTLIDDPDVAVTRDLSASFPAPVRLPAEHPAIAVARERYCWHGRSQRAGRRA